jgi:hypothetical protein
MQASQTELTALDSTYRVNLECRRREVEGLIAQLQARREEYNAAASSLNSVAERWQLEIGEFNERQPQRRRSR